MEAEDSADRAIVRAIGDELRRARGSVGWTRPELIKQMQTQMPVNTYAGYEQGIRLCSIPRLVEICEALGTSAPELLDLALQRRAFDSVEMRLLRQIDERLGHVEAALNTVGSDGAAT